MEFKTKTTETKHFMAPPNQEEGEQELEMEDEEEEYLEDSMPLHWGDTDFGKALGFALILSLPMLGIALIFWAAK